MNSKQQVSRFYAVGDFLQSKPVLLASYANKVFLSPDGGVLPKATVLARYSTKLYWKLDVNTHVFRVGTYKSAIEPFIRDDMSNWQKKLLRWLGQLWGAYVDDV